MVQGIEYLMGELKKVQTDEKLKQESARALNSQLSAAGLDYIEKDIIIWFYVNAENSETVSKRLNIEIPMVTNYHDSAIRKLGNYPPLQGFINQVKEYVRNLPK